MRQRRVTLAREPRVQLEAVLSSFPSIGLGRCRGHSSVVGGSKTVTTLLRRDRIPATDGFMIAFRHHM